MNLKVKEMLNKLMLGINSIGDWVIGWVLKIFAGFWTIVTLCCMFYLVWYAADCLLIKLWGLFNI